MHFVYRLRDAQGQLLYVGMSSANYQDRIAKHRSKPWGGSIADVTVEAYVTRSEALRAEATAICDESPLHNVAQTHDMPVPGERGQTARCPVCCSLRAVNPRGRFKAHWSASERCDGSGLTPGDDTQSAGGTPEDFRRTSGAAPHRNKGTREQGSGEGEGEGVRVETTIHSSGSVTRAARLGWMAVTR